MKKLKLIYVLTLAFALTLAACNGGGGGRRQKGGYVVPQYPDGPSVNIGGCIGLPWHLVTQEAFYDIAAAGINVIDADMIGTSISLADCLQILEYAEKAGVKVLVSDYDASLYAQKAGKFNLESNFPHYKDHPALYGVHLVDEPDPGDFPALKLAYDKVRAALPEGKHAFINVNDKTGDFSAHIKNYMETVAPDHLSYDMYSLIRDKWSDEFKVILKDNYYADLERVRHAAKDYGVWSHNYVLSISHRGIYTYPQPTEESLRWQIACYMAFGYDAFTHFTYFTPGNANAQTGDGWVYEAGAIDRDGKKTEIYDFFKTVNNEVHKWGNVYKSFTWQGTTNVAGSHGVYNSPLKTMKHAFSIADTDGLQSVVSTGDLLLGVFTDAAQNKGFMLVNAAIPYDGKAASAEVKFDAEYKGVMVFEKGVPAIKDLDGKNTAVIKLDSGEGKFLIPLKRG